MPRQLEYRRDADGYLPIESYGLIGNGRTVALVGADGSIDWCCFPRIDQPSVFGRILDAEKGGYWQIVPDEPWSATRAYLDDTNVLVTTFSTDNGEVELIDLMPSVAFGADLGLTQTVWDGMLLRFIRGKRGKVRLRQVIDPGFDYGRERATCEIIPGRGALLSGSNASLNISTTFPLESDDCRLTSLCDVKSGDGYFASLAFHGAGAAVWADIGPQTASDILEREIEGWQRWISRCTYCGPYAEHVRRGALVLKLLDYLPSGAMAAAATTSLPEWLGGERNWDYRYSWIRDTAYALHAFNSIGFGDEAYGFLQWVIDVTNDDPASLQIMYQVDGGQQLDEVILEHLSGYKGSRPVRIGNGAYSQRQLDRFGEVVDAAWVHRRFGGVVNRALWKYIVEIVELVEERWRMTDAGIWEVRSEPKRMTYSNVMCWVALDRAISLAELDGHAAPLERWRALRDTIRAEIMQQGVAPEGYFTQGFGDDVLDAAALSFPLRSFVAVDHPVMQRTIEAIQYELLEGGLVSRYKVHATAENVDGLAGHEGTFLLCTCWLIDCLTGLGRVDEAQELLESLLDRSNDLLLFAEEIDADSGAFLGNFPQAFSHLGVINAIVNVARARGEACDAPDDAYGDITGAIPPGPADRQIQAEGRVRE